MATIFPAKPKRSFYQRSWLQLVRPLTLTGTITPIIVGTLIAAQKGMIHIGYTVILLIAALFIQMATNIWNDYFDFKHGQDTLKWQLKRPAKSAPAHHELPYAAYILTLIAILLGGWLAVQTTIWILPVGIFGIIFGFYYSAGTHSLAAVGLGECTAAIFLGIIPMVLPYMIQGFNLDLDIIAIAIPFALLISLMILTNNIRDIKKDAEFRKTIAIILGHKAAARLFTILLALIYLWMLLLVITRIVPVITLITFLALPLGLHLRFILKQEMVDSICMKLAAYHHWAFGLLFIIALVIEQV